jgi:hypothetical protein
MKNMALILIACALIGPAAEAQVDTAWARVWDSDSYGQNIAVDDAGNVYVSGSPRLGGGSIAPAYNTDGQLLWTRYFGGPDSYGGSAYGMHLNRRGDISILLGGYCTVRYNALGDSLWSRIYRPMGEYATPAAIVSDDSGNVYVTGWCVYTNCWATVKYDRDGMLIWERIFDGYPGYYPLRNYDIALDRQGNVIVGGLTQTQGPDSVVGITMVKYNSAGDLLWISRHDSSDVFNHLYMAIDDDDNIYVSGQWPVSYPFRFIRQPLLIKFQPDGGTAWARIYGDTLARSTDPPVIAADSSGGVCVCGVDKLGPDSLDRYRFKYYVTKFTPDGDTAWGRCFDNTGYLFDYPVDIKVGRSGAIYVGGYSWRPLMNPDITIIKCSSDGDLIWSSTFAGDTLSSEYLNDLALDRSENIYITGKMFIEGIGEKMITIKFVQSPTEANDGSFPLPEGVSRTAYPNPFNAQTTISYSLSQTGAVKIDIFNILGQKVTVLDEGVHATGEHKVVWEAEGLPSGVYFARLSVGGETETAKMVLLK